MMYAVLEPASLDNLNEDAYLGANLDVKNAGMTAHEHFTKFGVREGRRQLASEYLENLTSYRAAKFQKFKDILDLNNEALATATLPIAVGRHLTLDDYQAESSGAGFGPFEDVIVANPGKLYLDIGCGFRDRVFLNCLYLEVYPSRTADLIVEPTCTYPIKSSTLDGIGCFAVLEHTRQPWLVVQEISRMLKPGGKVFIDWPFLQPVHGFPSHFFNATREGLRSIFEDAGFNVEIVATGAHQSPAWTVQWLLRDMLARLSDGSLAKENFRKITVEELSKIPPDSDFWRQVLGELPDSAISEFACGNWLSAVKK
jgi:SAM-dependent methyltransferase